jgi:hypothetical protein
VIAITLAVAIVCLFYLLPQRPFAEITTWVDQLATSIVVRPSVEPREFWEHYFRQDFTALVGAIKHSLRLDLRVRIGYVNAGGKLTAPAWIELPKTMAPYGTEAFRRTIVTLYIRKEFLQTMPFEAIVCAVAHEMSHIILEAVGHSLRDNEKAVDLTAMLLGFSDFYRRGITVPDSHLRYEKIIRGSGMVDSEDKRSDRMIIHKFSYLTVEEVQHAALLLNRMRGLRRGK